jgi:hypothetical protein
LFPVVKFQFDLHTSEPGPFAGRHQSPFLLPTTVQPPAIQIRIDDGDLVSEILMEVRNYGGSGCNKNALNLATTDGPAQSSLRDVKRFERQITHAI